MPGEVDYVGCYSEKSEVAKRIGRTDDLDSHSIDLKNKNSISSCAQICVDKGSCFLTDFFF